MTWIRSGVLVAMLAVGMTTGAAASVGQRPQLKFNATDQRAAQAVVIHRADLGAAVKWTRQPAKPDPGLLTCRGYNPKQSDLVATGAARSVYTYEGLTFDSEVWILRTAAMVDTDWQRTVTPGAVSCAQAAFEKMLGPKGRVISVRRVTLPSIGRHAVAYRLIGDSPLPRPVRVFVDAVYLAGGRTEITLTTTEVVPRARLASEPRDPIIAAQIRLARVLAARAS